MNKENQSTIKLWGEEITLCYGFRAERLMREFKPDFKKKTQDGTIEPDELIVTVVWAGLPTKYSDKTEADVAEAIDQNGDAQEINKAVVAWKSSVGFIAESLTGQSPEELRKEAEQAQKAEKQKK